MLDFIAETVPAMLTFVDRRLYHRYANRLYCEAFGSSPQEILGRHTRAVVGEPLFRALGPHFERALAGETVSYERPHRWPDGRDVVLSVRMAPQRDRRGRVTGIAGVLIDVTESRRTEAALRDSESRLRTITDHLPALIAYVGPDEVYRFANRTYRDWFGRAPDTIVGRTMREVLGESSYAIAEPYVRTALSGQITVHDREVAIGERRRWLHNVYVPHLDAAGKVQGIFILATDISDRKALEAHLERMAQHDPLTGVPNRVLFEDRLAQGLERSRRSGQAIALMYLDLDDFKAINDRYGHRVGDELLKAFAARLVRSVRGADTVARLGGDEFAILLEDIARPEDAVRVAEKIAAAMREPFELASATVHACTSIGIALGVGGRDSGAALIERADAAMYRAKAIGRNAYHLAE